MLEIFDGSLAERILSRYTGLDFFHMSLENYSGVLFMNEMIVGLYFQLNHEGRLLTVHTRYLLIFVDLRDGSLQEKISTLIRIQVMQL